MTKSICINYNVPVKTLTINSETDLYCILGKPVRHSLSPVLHNSAFIKTGMNAVYLAFEPSSIQSAVQSMKSLGIKGASVTIPYKIDVIPFLDAIDSTAAAIGAVNTLVNSGGRITGYNTDGYGALRALENKKIRVGSAAALILGNGGSARAIASALLQNGATVFLAGRNASRIKKLARELGGKQDRVHSLLINDLDRNIMERIDIIINTTPVGMSPDIDSMPLCDGLIMRRHTVFDIVYTPFVTKLLAVARNKNCTVVNGIDMLIFQGARQFELWTGKPAPVEAISAAIVKHVRG